MQVRTTRNVAMMSTKNNKRSIDNSYRDSGINKNERRLLEEKHNRVQFAAIGSSEEYVDVNTEDMKKQRSIAPVDTVSKDILLSSTRQTNERITYDQLVLESQQSENDNTSEEMAEVTSDQQPQLQQSKYLQPPILGVRQKENLRKRSQGRGSIEKRRFKCQEYDRKIKKNKK
mmetsp:Transcript_22536/g.21765  ORF Transcript_22536/g.21765 Transcript_22536/m.21765 type:complete len:173 (-) Transcript_22536:31-549(-)